MRRVPPEGIQLALTYDGPLGELAARAYADTEADPAASSLTATLTLHAASEDAVVVSGRLAGQLVVPCDRCAEATAVAIDAPVNATFIPAREVDEDDDEVELQASDLDTYTYAGDEVDLEELLREQLVVAIPMTHLCAPGCKGLCTQCGQNWNEGPCGCTPVELAAPNPLAAALKNVKLSK